MDFTEKLAHNLSEHNYFCSKSTGHRPKPKQTILEEVLQRNVLNCLYLAL